VTDRDPVKDARKNLDGGRLRDQSTISSSVRMEG